MKEYTPKKGKLVPIFPGVLDRQQRREKCGSFLDICNLSVPAISTAEGDVPRHRLCVWGNSDIRPWCGAQSLEPPKKITLVNKLKSFYLQLSSK